MAKLKKTISFETTFGTYVVDELLGEGGAGRVYGGSGDDGTAIALKVLSKDRATTDKRRRFKNEIAFLAQNKHPNIVFVTDHGVAQGSEIAGPFYVMRRYSGSLRAVMREGIRPANVLSLFSQILDGVEAAHLKGVVHRDLKPENILYDRDSNMLAVADFGIASFTEDIVVTLVETDSAQRLANFQYASPEQRTAGMPVQATADIYALGLILNEMFTGTVPHGTEYRLIGQVAKEFEFLDGIVAKMLRQQPQDRPTSVADIKALVQQHQAEAVTLQRLSKIDGTVVKAIDIDEPLAQQPPRLIGADWDHGLLTLKLDRSVSADWITALGQMGSYSSVMVRVPRHSRFAGIRPSSVLMSTRFRP